METVFSLSHARADGSSVVFDFVVSPDDARWWRHDFDAAGEYEAVGLSSLEEVRDALADDAPATYVLELRSAAARLEAAVADLLEVAQDAAGSGDADAADQIADRAGRVERERLRVLDEVIRTCDAAWEDAIGRVERARADDRGALPGAIRDVELLWTARRAVRRTLGGEHAA